MVLLICFVNFFLFKKKNIILKNGIYECGFENFSNLNENYDLRFFIIGIIFLIFDIEIIFLIPISLNIYTYGFFGF